MGISPAAGSSSEDWDPSVETGTHRPDLEVTKREEDPPPEERATGSPERFPDANESPGAQDLTRLLRSRPETASQPENNSPKERVSPQAQDPELEFLRNIFIGPEREELRHLTRRLAQLEAKFRDKAALAEAIAPALGPALRKEIREAQDEIIEALYPIIGRLVMRAVTEAMRDLVQAVEARLTAAMDWPNVIKRKIRAWWSGVPEAELALREALDGAVEQIFLIHRESGLLLWHQTRESYTEPDPDLIGAMLTAIQNFVAQILGEGADKEGFHELAVGQRTILVEFGPYSYVAAAVRGVPPPGLRQRLALRVLDFDSAVQDHLRHYQGDPEQIIPVARELFKEFLVPIKKQDHL